MMPKMVYDKLGERRREEVEERGDSVGRKTGGIGLRLCFFFSKFSWMVVSNLQKFWLICIEID